MHDTHDVRKSRELHDKEMLIDDQRPTAPELDEDQVYRYELLKVLERIAKALEYIETRLTYPIQVRKEY